MVLAGIFSVLTYDIAKALHHSRCEIVRCDIGIADVQPASLHAILKGYADTGGDHEQKACVQPFKGLVEHSLLLDDGKVGAKRGLGEGLQETVHQGLQKALGILCLEIDHKRLVLENLLAVGDGCIQQGLVAFKVAVKAGFANADCHCDIGHADVRKSLFLAQRKQGKHDFLFGSGDCCDVHAHIKTYRTVVSQSLFLAFYLHLLWNKLCASCIRLEQISF